MGASLQDILTTIAYNKSQSPLRQIQSMADNFVNMRTKNQANQLFNANMRSKGFTPKENKGLSRILGNTYEYLGTPISNLDKAKIKYYLARAKGDTPKDNKDNIWKDAFNQAYKFILSFVHIFF